MIVLYLISSNPEILSLTVISFYFLIFFLLLFSIFKGVAKMIPSEFSEIRTITRLNNPIIKMFRADKNAVIPKYATEGSHGLDLVSVETVKIAPYDRVTIRTGIHMEIPERYAGFVCPRSGMASKHGITVLNSPGLVDCDFRGEVKVILYNSSGIPFLVEEGMKIAQLVIMLAPKAEIVESNSLEDLTKTERGHNGFGSTGK